MNICYSATKNYYQYLPTVINSLLVNNSKVDTVYIFAEDDIIPNINHSKIQVINVNNYPCPLQETSPNYKNNPFSKMPLYKLYGCKILNVSRAIFIDVDTIVDGNIEELWNMDLGSNVLAMVKEHKMSIDHGFNYFNGGVVLMDMDKMRRNALDDVLLYWVNVLKLSFFEQDAINYYLKGLILEVPSKWNWGIGTAYTEKPIIRHYMSSYKPWNNSVQDGMWQKYYVDKLEDTSPTEEIDN